jgi:uncharacterized protein YggU (UPF0235/DUF167 family)
VEGGAVLAARVRPRSQPGLSVRDDVLTIGVAAPPADGRATEEARRALAGALGVPPSSVRLRAGGAGGRRSRSKLFEVAGLTAAQVTRRLAGGHIRPLP